MVVDLGLSLGALVGVLLSGGYVYLEVGRYATPQVPETLFDERREVFAYTAGLFVGIPLAVAFLLFLVSMSNGALPGALLFLAALVAGTEVAQWALLRAHYWIGASGPFYALGYRAGIGGIFALALVAQYLAGPTTRWDGVALVVLESFAVVVLEVAGALLSLPPSEPEGRKGGGPVPGAIFGAVGFFVLGVGALSGTATPSNEAVAYAAAVIALLGGLLVYARLRPMLALVPAPSAGGAPPARRERAAFGRTDRSPAGEPSDDRRA